MVVYVALRRKKLVCPNCAFSTMAREHEQRHDSIWRHLDLGTWRLEVHARLRRLRCPEHGVHVEGVPFARDGARFTRDFDDLVAWLATKTDKTATCRLIRIDWQTIGRVIKRVADELIDTDRLSGLFEISIDEVAWRKGHRDLTLVGDHDRGCVVWGTEGKGQAAADEFDELDPPPAEPSAHAEQRSAAARAGDHGPVRPEPDRARRAWYPGWMAAAWRGARARDLRARLPTHSRLDGHDRRVRQERPRARAASDIVIDNYHVVQLASKALDEVRREHWNELRATGDPGAAKTFKHSRWSLLKNPNDLNDQQAATLAQIQAGGGKTARAWAMKRWSARSSRPA